MSRLFVFEGPNNVGKTTISMGVELALRLRGIRCERLSFPGHDVASLGPVVREVHAHAARGDLEIHPAALQIMHVAAHVDAIERRILPLLTDRVTVLLDRFWWSTAVYAEASGVSVAQTRAILETEAVAWRDTSPSLTFLVRRTSPSVNASLATLYEALASHETKYPVQHLDNNGTLDDVIAQAVDTILAQCAMTSESLRHTMPLDGASPESQYLFPIVRRPRQRDARGSNSSQKQPGSIQSELNSDGAASSLPLLFSCPKGVKPSRVYDTFWKFAAERQEVFFRRFLGVEGTLSTDPILRHHKFTNAYRASDRVSQYLIRHVIYDGAQDVRDVFFRTLLFKFFNKISTWQLLLAELGEISWGSYNRDRYNTILTRLMANGVRIYSAAYIMPTASGFGDQKRKHLTHLRLLEQLMTDDVPHTIASATTMRQAFDALKRYPMMGDFLAYQFITDINYSNITNFSEMEFVVPGPGARDGIRKCFVDAGGFSEGDLIKLVTERQETEFDRLGISFRSLWGRPLQLIDCQNLFCETDKYARLAHPEVSGISGRTRIKQIYKRTHEPLEYWYPPKWGLNSAIAADLARPVAEQA